MWLPIFARNFILGTPPFKPPSSFPPPFDSRVSPFMARNKFQSWLLNFGSALHIIGNVQTHHPSLWGGGEPKMPKRQSQVEPKRSQKTHSWGLRQPSGVSQQTSHRPFQQLQLMGGGRAVLEDLLGGGSDLPHPPPVGFRGGAYSPGRRRGPRRQGPKLCDLLTLAIAAAPAPLLGQGQGQGQSWRWQQRRNAHF